MWLKSGQWDIRGQFPERESYRRKFLLSFLLKWLKKQVASFATSSSSMIVRDPASAWNLHCEQQMKWKESGSFMTPWAAGSTRPEACPASVKWPYIFPQHLSQWSQVSVTLDQKQINWYIWLWCWFKGISYFEVLETKPLPIHRANFHLEMCPALTFF